MATAVQSHIDESNERIAALMIRLEADRDVKFTPLAVVGFDGPEAHILVGFKDRSRVDLMPQEAILCGIALRLERPYPDYEPLARRFDAAATHADLAAANIARGYRFDHQVDQHRVVPA